VTAEQGSSALIWSAIAQAASAAVVALFTVRLVYWTRKLSDFTHDYVEEMRRSNDLIAEGNVITASMVAVSQGQALPRLVVQQRGRKANPQRVEAPLVVANYGGGVAEGVVVVTSWGEGSLPSVLPSGAEGKTKVGLPRAEWEQRDDKNPIVERVRYRDTTGAPHDEELP
jgi:hypothetical protein